MADEHRLSFVESIFDDGTLHLSHSRGMTTATVGGVSYLFVAGGGDDGVSVFAVGSDGTLTNVDNVADDATLELDGARGVATAEIAGTTYLFVAGDDDSGVSVFSVSPGGALANVFNVADGGALELSRAAAVSTGSVGGNPFLIVVGRSDDGISVFSIGADGTLTNTSNVDQSADPAYNITNAVSLGTAEVGGATYVFVGAGSAVSGGNGVSVFSLDTSGVLTNVANVDDTDNSDYQLANVSSLTTAVVDGTTYLFAAGAGDNGVSAFSVAGNGQLSFVDSIGDGAGLNLSGAGGLSTAVIGGASYLFVTANTGDAVSMFRIADDGTLSLVDSVVDSDSPDLTLDGAWATTVLTIGNSAFMFATSTVDDGLSAFSIGDNEAPQFAFDPTPLSFGENTVNATPQAVFAGVTVADPNLNLDGGTLIVRGHLGEDTIGILSDGTGAGQIDVAAGAVSYEGAEIATVSGGAGGADLVVDFESGVTAAGVEALIEHLTYANSSDTPTTSRDIEIILRDGDGASAIYPEIDFANSGGDLSGLSVSGETNVLPVFADIDGDGDFDAIVASSNENFFYYENTGTADSPAFLLQNSPANNPFSSIPSTSSGSAAPALADLDHDGDLELLALNDSSTLVYYENTGTRDAASFDLGNQSAFSGLSFTGAELPTFVDLDNDGDYDLVVGSADGSIHYFENTGTTTGPDFVEKTGADNPFDGIDAGTHSYGSFADVDKDGDLDAIVGGTDTGGVAYLENVGDAHSPVFDQPANPLNGFNSVIGARGSLVDIDGDGDTDAVFGDADGGAVTFAENLAPARGPSEFYQVGGSPLDGLGLASSTDSHSVAYVDLDGDGDLDAVVGEGGSSLRYFENLGSPRAAAFVEQTGGDNPFDGFTFGTERVEFAFADLDGDGDLDAIVGAGNGTNNGLLEFLENTGTATAPAFLEHSGSGEPFDGITTLDARVSPRLADIDGDGDLDLIVGTSSGELDYFLNDGSPAGFNFQQQFNGDNPFDGIDVGGAAAPAFRDFDQDGDLDLVVGTSDGVLNYFENTGSATVPAFVERGGADNPFDGIDVGYQSKPAFADLDGDGVAELTVADKAGSFPYFEQGAGFLLTINVNAENDAPVASDDAQTTDEDTPLDAQVPAASDVDGTIDHYALVDDVAKGTLTFDGDGTYSFDPSGAFDDLNVGDHEDATFTYRAVDDQGGQSAAQTVTVTVTGVNDAPTVTLPASPTVDEDSVDNAITGISVGDVDSASLTVTLEATSTLSLGTITGLTFTDGDGTGDETMTFSGTVADINAALATLTYTPTPDDDGDGSIVVTADDGDAGPVGDTLAIAITAVNDLPVAYDDSQTTSEDLPLTTLVPAASDIDGAIDHYVLDADVAKGFLTFVGDRNYIYDPRGAFDYLAPGEHEDVTFTYHTVDDQSGQSDVKTVTITVSGVNDAPQIDQGVADRSSPEDTPLSFQVPADAFFDPEGDALTYSALLADGSPLPAWLHFSAATRTFSGTPPTDFNGALTLSLSASDGHSVDASVPFTLTIAPVNDPPAITSNGGGKTAVVSIAENSQAVTTVTSADVDGPSRTYSIGKGGDAAFFTIDTKTGALAFKTAPDFEFSAGCRSRQFVSGGRAGLGRTVDRHPDDHRPRHRRSRPCRHRNQRQR